nr:MAG TPA: hypothetical protein [Caudoviricetes sp.]
MYLLGILKTCKPKLMERRIKLILILYLREPLP